MRVKYSFDAQEETEVSVVEGEVCDVTFDVNRDKGWFEVVKANDQRGLIPVSFCDVIEESVVAPAQLDLHVEPVDSDYDSDFTDSRGRLLSDEESLKFSGIDVVNVCVEIAMLLLRTFQIFSSKKINK